MSVRLIYFVHGTTADNEREISTGCNDVGLSELGIQQAKELANQTKDMQFDVVFTSDLQRSIDSARLTWGDKYPTVRDVRLRECDYGDLNGEPSSVVEPLQEQAIHTPMPNGESYEMVKARLGGFLQDLKKDYEGKTVAVVAHKAPQLALDVLVKGLSWEQAFEQDWRKTKNWQPGWEYIVT